jgi:hypothetical protein
MVAGQQGPEWRDGSHGWNPQGHIVSRRIVANTAGMQADGAASSLAARIQGDEVPLGGRHREADVRHQRGSGFWLGSGIGVGSKRRSDENRRRRSPR